MSLPNPVVLLDARARYAHPALRCERLTPKHLFGPTGRRQLLPSGAMPWEYDPETGEAIGLRLEDNAVNLVAVGDMAEWNTADVISSVSDRPALTEGRNWRRMEAVGGGVANRRFWTSFAAEAGNYYTVSFDVMPDQVRFLQLTLNDSFLGDGGHVRFMLSLETGEYHFLEWSGRETPTAQVKRAGHGWRVAITARAYTSMSENLLHLRLKSGMTSDLADELAAGDGLFVDSPQVERSSNLPTVPVLPSSYIPTDGSLVERAADSVWVDVAGRPWYNSRRGTLVADVVPWSNDMVPVLAIMAQGSPDPWSYIGVQRESNGSWTFFERWGSDGDSVGLGQSSGNGIRSRIAFSFDLDESVGWASAEGAPAQPLDLSMNQEAQMIHVGSHLRGGTGFTSKRPNGWTQRVYYYPAEVSPADLQSLTSIQGQE